MTGRRSARAAGAAVTMAAWVLWMPVSVSASARAPAASFTETFGYQGAVAQTVTVPLGATVAEIRVVGAKGGGTKSAGKSITGGDGAQVSGRVAVSTGQVMTLRVAQYGGDGNGKTSPGGGGWGATGYGGRGGSGYGYKDERDGGGGGGASSLEIGGETVVVAGGGGGGGGNGFDSIADSGGPGGSSGATVDPGHNGKGPGGGKGGGGAANGGPTGGSGGSSTSKAIGGGAGGGGAGVVGGGGGGGGGTGGGGGGGGGAGSSRYTSRLEAPSVVRGSTSDGNGLIVITWNVGVSAPVCSDETVHVPFDSPGVPVRLHCTDASRPTSFRIDLFPEHGHVENLDLTTGTFIYVPDPGYRGSDTILFRAFSGDVASVPYSVIITVGRPAAPMYLTASPADVVLGHPPVLTVIMPANATGYVGFYDLYQDELRGIGTAPIIDGVATLTAPTRELGVGVHFVHASYGGDFVWAPADSNDVTVIVRAP